MRVRVEACARGLGGCDVVSYNCGTPSWRTRVARREVPQRCVGTASLARRSASALTHRAQRARKHPRGRSPLCRRHRAECNCWITV